MKRTMVFLLALILLVVACRRSPEPTPTPTGESELVQVVSVTGQLLPAQRAVLAHDPGGKVTEVLVEMGDQVAADEPLVQLDTTDLELALAQAEQEVAAQRALLAQLRAGATGETVSRAARDNVHLVAQAEITLQAAQQQLAQVEAEDPAQAVAVAQARVQQVQRQIDQTRALDPVAEVTLAQVEVERARIALDDVQNEYNKALDRPWEPQSVRDGLQDQVKQAELNLRAAQARLEQATAARRANALRVSILEAQLAEAQAMLAQAENEAAAYPIALETQRAKVHAAEEQLAYLRTWENPYRDPARGEEVAQAEAALEQARLAAAQVRQQVHQATLRAPFAGTVGAVNVRVGEWASPGEALAVVGDLGTLRVETTDLDEIDVVRVSPGQGADVTFDALPGQVYKGQVEQISPLAETESGGVNYTVIITLAEIDPRLRWGMTAFVDIEAENP